MMKEVTATSASWFPNMHILDIGNTAPGMPFGLFHMYCILEERAQILQIFFPIWHLH